MTQNTAVRRLLFMRLKFGVSAFRFDSGSTLAFYRICWRIKVRSANSSYILVSEYQRVFPTFRPSTSDIRLRYEVPRRTRSGPVDSSRGGREAAVPWRSGGPIGAGAVPAGLAAPFSTYQLHSDQARAVGDRCARCRIADWCLLVAAGRLYMDGLATGSTPFDPDPIWLLVGSPQGVNLAPQRNARDQGLAVCSWSHREQGLHRNAWQLRRRIH